MGLVQIRETKRNGRFGLVVKKSLERIQYQQSSIRKKKKVKSNPDVLVCQVDMEHQQFWSIRGVL